MQFRVRSSLTGGRGAVGGLGQDVRRHGGPHDFLVSLTSRATATSAKMLHSTGIGSDFVTGSGKERTARKRTFDLLRKEGRQAGNLLSPWARRKQSIPSLRRSSRAIRTYGLRVRVSSRVVSTRSAGAFKGHDLG